MAPNPAQLSAEQLVEIGDGEEGDRRFDDPFMPSVRRFPRDAWPPVGSNELPSGMRPFVLRGARQVSSAATAKHRTTPHQTPHTSETTKDGTSVPDTWYEPDD